MIELSGTAYLWIKALHIMSFIAWMAGMLYLPRLFVYHAEAAEGSDRTVAFKVMERRLLRAIVNPAMIATVLFGAILLANLGPEAWSQGWLHVKLLSVAGLVGVHVVLARCRRAFEVGSNRHGTMFYRVINETVTLLMVVIVIMVVVRPF